MSNSSEPNYRNNFYERVNRDWLADPNNVIPSEYPRWGGFIQLHDQGLKNQISLVQNLCAELKSDPKSLNESQLKIAATWDASNRRFESWDNNTADLEAILIELRYLDEHLNSYSVESVAKYFYYTQLNGIGNTFNFDKESDFKNTENLILDFNVGGISLPTRDYYFDPKFADKLDAFTTHLNNVRNLVNSAGGNLPESFTSDVLSFETEMAMFKMSPEQMRRFTEYYTDTTLSGLLDARINDFRYLPEKENHYDEADRQFKIEEPLLSSVNTFFSTVFELFSFRDLLKKNRALHYTDCDGNIRADAPGEEQMYVWDGDGIRRMLRLVLNPDNFQRYRSFLQYKIISSNKAFTTQAMDEEFFDFYARKMSGTQEQQPRDKRTINTINGLCGELMGQVYVQKYFPSTHKEMMMDLIKGVRSSMDEAIRSNSWLQDETKEKALEKLELFTVKIGYPDIWKDYSELKIATGDSMYTIATKLNNWLLENEFYRKLNAPRDHSEWEMTPQTVNAYYHSLHNEIVFPAAILQPPFFMTKIDTIDFNYSEEQQNGLLDDRLVLYAANCGGIIAVIAHEITHGYDDKGREFDGHGTQVDWWTEQDSIKFKELSKLMSVQTSKYSFEVDSQKYEMNSELTMGENLADLGGLSLGLRTLKNELKRSNVNDEDAKPYLRIFFKSFANIWRQKITDVCRIKLITLDPHAPCDFRANLVANIDAFYDAFDVVEGDGMYLAPNERLSMW